MLPIIINKLKLKKNHKELYEGSIIAFSLKIFGLLLGYIFTFLIGKFLGASALGSFLIGVTVLNFLTVISCFGLETTLVAFVSREAKITNNTFQLLRKSFWIVLAASFMILIVVYIGINAFNLYVGSLGPSVKRIINILLISIIPLSFLKLVANFLRGAKRISDYSFLNFVSISLVSLLILGFSMFFLELSEISLAAIYLIAIIISSIIGFILLIKNKSQVGDGTNRINISELIGFSFPILVSDILKNSRNWMALLIVGYLLSEKEAGIIGVLLKLSFAPSLLINAVNSIAMPKFSELYSQNRLTELKETLSESARVIFFSSFPVLIGLFFFSNLILRFLGEDFKVDSFLIFILLSGVFFEVISGTSAYFLQMIGRQKDNTIILLIANFVLVILCFILIPLYALKGAVIAVSASFITYSVLLVLYSKYSLGFNTVYFPFRDQFIGFIKKISGIK